MVETPLPEIASGLLGLLVSGRSDGWDLPPELTLFSSKLLLDHPSQSSPVAILCSNGFRRLVMIGGNKL